MLGGDLTCGGMKAVKAPMTMGAPMTMCVPMIVAAPMAVCAPMTVDAPVPGKATYAHAYAQTRNLVHVWQW